MTDATESTAEPEPEEPLEVLTDDACWDAELRCLVAVVESMRGLDVRAQRRVLRWAIARYWPEKMLVNA